MNGNNVTVLTPRSSTEFDDDGLKTLKTKLFEMETSAIPANYQVQRVLANLSQQLLEMYGKGFSLTEISSFLSRCGIKVPRETLKEHFEQEQIKRLSVCEETISNFGKLSANGASERSAFIERGLSNALKNKCGLVVHYQPQVDLHTGKVIGAEALLRWTFNGALISPVEFIPVAEESGLIVEIGEWVMREACQEAKRWQLMDLGGNNDIRMNVNLSVKQLSDGLLNMVHGVLCDTGLPTHLLGLEITESFLAEHESLDILHELQRSGIHLSIDDFGTGYSCLSQLNNLPIDTIKIDRAFVTDINSAMAPSPVVEAIITVAQKLNMGTLAEGVETVEQVEALKRMGCSVCQGFLYSKPICADEFIQFVNAQNSSVPELQVLVANR